MKGKPKYKFNQDVEFSFTKSIYDELTGESKLEKETLRGNIYIIDEYGTWNNPDDVSYDIMVNTDKGMCLYKHITESKVSPYKISKNVTRTEVIKKFLEHKCAYNNHQTLTSTGDRLLSYKTCIAQWKGDTLIINTGKYSSTTSAHRNLIIYYFTRMFPKGISQMLNDVPRNTSSLLEYAK